ncbi:MAG TPA: hypothetical protein PLQ20_00020 [Candidatus Paceibacterota bacterium]|nr:hypothetical protein [Candidatus Paceibacterota bacterium]
MSVVFVILIFVSCGKNSGGAGGGGHVEPNPPAETKPKISATAPSKAWYGENAVGSVTATNATSVTASPGVVNGNSYTVSSVTGPLDVKLVAHGQNGQTAETTVVADCWSPQLSEVFKSGAGDGIFRLTAIQIDGGPIQTSGLVCLPIQFLPDGTTKTYGSECAPGGGISTGQWSLVGEGIVFANQAYDKITFLNNKTFVVEFRNNNNNQLVKRWFSKN